MKAIDTEAGTTPSTRATASAAGMSQESGGPLKTVRPPRARRIALYALVVGFLGAAYHYRVLPPTADALLDYFLYLSLATTVTPLPTVPAILYAATQAPAFWIAVIGAAGTVVAYLIEYAILHKAMNLARLDGVKRSRAYVGLARLFRRAPFVALSVAAFLPIPIDAVRLMAIAESYPRAPYALAAFLGRFPRYLAIALLGRSITWSWPIVVGAAAALALGAVVSHLVTRRRRRSDAALTVAALCIAGASWWAAPSTCEAEADPAPSASPAELERVLGRFDEAVAGLRDAHGRFRQQRWSPVFGDVEESEGELWYRAPDDLVLRYQKPEHQEVFIDTAGVWIYLVKQRQAQRYPFSGRAERDGSLAVLWRSSERLATRYHLELGSGPPAGEKDGVWLRLRPRDDDLAQVVDVLYLRVNDQTGLSDCILVERANGERVRLEMRDFDRNPSLAAERFVFSPPDSVEIVRFDE